MAEFDTKFGKIFAEKSEKEETMNVGVAGGDVNGFASVPVDKRSLQRAAAILGSFLLLRGMGKRKREKAVLRTEKRALDELARRIGLFGKKRR